MATDCSTLPSPPTIQSTSPCSWGTARGFHQARNFDVGISSNAVAAGDFNFDRLLDLAVARYHSGVAVVINNTQR